MRFHPTRRLVVTTAASAVLVLGAGGAAFAALGQAADDMDEGADSDD